MAEEEVAEGFQHSPANMAFFSIAATQGTGPGWWDAIVWNIIPAGVGNILGGTILVAGLLSWAFRSAGSGSTPESAQGGSNQPRSH